MISLALHHCSDTAAYAPTAALGVAHPSRGGYNGSGTLDLSSIFWRHPVCSSLPRRALASRRQTRVELPAVIDPNILDRCRQLIAESDEQLGWSLGPSAREHYAAVLAPLLDGLPEERWPAVAANYHTDHNIVAALRAADHPDHNHAWTRWCAQVIGVLRRSGRGWPEDGVLTIDDLAQTARLALAQALPGYRYRSRFSSWAYSVIERSARDQLRAAHAQRRSGSTTSLDSLAEASQPSDLSAAHEQSAHARLLAERIAVVLDAHPDRRLARIFHLWAVEDRTSAEIGMIVNLHESRVRALLKLARALLRADPELQEWNERER